MHTEISVDNLFELFLEFGLSTMFLDEKLEEMKEPKVLLSVKSVKKQGFVSVLLIDKKKPFNSVNIDVTSGLYVNKQFELVPIERM